MTERSASIPPADAPMPTMGHAGAPDSGSFSSFADFSESVLFIAAPSSLGSLRLRRQLLLQQGVTVEKELANELGILVVLPRTLLQGRRQFDAARRALMLGHTACQR